MTTNSSFFDPHVRGCRCKICRPITIGDIGRSVVALRQIAAVADARVSLRAMDSAPRRPRSQRAILTDIIAAIDRRMPQKRRKIADDMDPDYIAPVTSRPVNPLTSAAIDSRAAAAQKQNRICINWEKELAAAGAKMRAAFRPA